MCCGQDDHHSNVNHMNQGSICNCGCGCGCNHSFRQYFSDKEKKEYLEDYKMQLEKEIHAVNEHLEKLKIQCSCNE
ncbi:hypothetical protein [Methanosalsum natronophilum]|uniref:hypothetical protein n=1 Tax=Methanosalsum natronophilum TaxID=768733 RepID=UPI0021677CF7|nr:hypothetical protein [Methanosalsum natronophilum]MCS3923867.1 hypothetical protein [Methanosalsum natronophilum]